MESHLLCHSIHTLVSGPSSVIQKQWTLPVVVVRLQDVPRGIALPKVPHVQCLISGSGNHACLETDYVCYILLANTQKTFILVEFNSEL